MDVIKITPEELRDMAEALEALRVDSIRSMHDVGIFEDRELIRRGAERLGGYRSKLARLAYKLEADKREALEFIPAKGVQA